jgi:hypothetical protein
LSIGARTAILLATVGGAWAVAAPIAYTLDAGAGAGAATLAAAVAAAGSLAALLLASLLRGPSRALIGLLGGMFFRMAPPLIVALVAQQRGGPLAEGGLVYYLAVFYLVAMVAEVGLSLSLVERTPPQHRPV